MRDAFPVRGIESVTNLRRVLQCLIERQWPFQRSALDVLHDQVVRADIVNLADVWMVQRGDGVSFALKAFGKMFGGGLDRDIAAPAAMHARG